MHPARRAVLLPVVFLLAIYAACASTPADRIAYNSIDGAVTGVQTGMRAFNDLYQQGKATETDRERVLVAYKQFQSVARLATDLAANVTPAQRPSVIQIVSDAALDLFKVLNEFGITQPKGA